MKSAIAAAIAALLMLSAAPAVHAQPIEGSIAQAGAIRMRYLHAGSGQVTIVLLHGWPADSHEWRKVIPLLASRYRVVAPDLRGIGGTETPAEGYDKATMARDVHSLVASLKPGKVVVVGHDIGGQGAYAYARQFPAEVAGVVILDVPLPGIAPWDQIKSDPRAWHFGFNVQTPLAEELVAGREAKLVRYFVDKTAMNPKAVTDEDVATFAAAYRAPDHLRAGFAFYRAFPEDEKFNAAQTAPLATPILLAGADHSMGPMEALVAADLRRKGAADVTIATIAESGHWIAEEQPQATAELIDGFVTRVAGGR